MADANRANIVGLHAGWVRHTTKTSELFWVADVIYKWSFENMENMAEKEAVVCSLLALFVENKKKTLVVQLKPSA